MKASEALRKLADLTASQWGMVTTAQAGALGITRLMLARLAESGHLERLAHGVYRDVGAPSDEFEDLRAAWLSTDPKILAEDRLDDRADGVVIASTSAALLHGVGDLWANRHEFVAAKRRQTQRAEIRYRQRHLEDRDVTLVEGLPTMVLERNLSDLLEDTGELSLVADALNTATKKRQLDFDRLRELLSPLAARHGFKPYDGNAVLDQLLETAGLDLESVARRISGDPALGSRVLMNYLKQAMPSIEMPHLGMLKSDLTSLTSVVPDSVEQTIRAARGLRLDMGETTSKALAGSVMPDVSKALADLVNTLVLPNISQQWAQDLTAIPALISAHEAVSTDQEPEQDDPT